MATPKTPLMENPFMGIFSLLFGMFVAAAMATGIVRAYPGNPSFLVDVVAALLGVLVGAGAFFLTLLVMREIDSARGVEGKAQQQQGITTSRLGVLSRLGAGLWVAGVLAIAITGLPGIAIGAIVGLLFNLIAAAIMAIIDVFGNTMPESWKKKPKK